MHGGYLQRAVAERLEKPAGQGRQVLGLPVVVLALGFGAVHHRLLFDVRSFRDQVDDGVAEGADGGQVGVGVGGSPAVTDEDADDVATVPVLRDERCGRRDPDCHGGGQLRGADSVSTR